MRRAGLVVWEAHQAAARRIRPGATTQELDDAIVEVFRRYSATPLFLGYPGETPFPAATCISINEEVVHGIPGPRRLAVGDIVSVDTGCRLQGWCGDAAVTHAVGAISPAAQTLLDTTSGVLNLAIKQLATQARWSAIAQKMQKMVERAGFSVVESLVGHGIGREMHEPPQVPNYFSPDMAKADFDVRPGLVLAIEPMVNAGGKKVRTLADHWTIVTADGSWSAHFEHTVARTESGVQILTAEPSREEMELVGAEFRRAEDWVRW